MWKCQINEDGHSLSQRDALMERHGELFGPADLTEQWFDALPPSPWCHSPATIRVHDLGLENNFRRKHHASQTHVWRDR
jgi:hypothetical protein